jgi:DNA invertase Pin-like site-specific DNA recombinase
MTRAAIYCRISADREGAGLGVDRQRQDCEQLVEQRRWEVAGVYTDNDISAYQKRKPRPAYERLMADAKARRIDAIVVWHTDRLHRQPRELEDFVDVVETAGTQIDTVKSGAIDLSTPTGRMVARMLGAAAAYESEHKAERIARKHEELARDGKPILGGHRPFGYLNDHVTVNPPEAELIREAASRVIAGDSLRGIAADWGRRGITTPAGKPWQPFPLKRMLTSARIAGLREHRGVIVAEGWEAVIDRPTLERLRAILRDAARRTTTSNARSYLLSGLLSCSRCGKPLHARPRKDHVRRYICASGPMYHGCGKIATLSEPLEALVVDAVLYRLETPAFAAEQARQAADVDDADADRLVAAEASLQELSRDFYDAQLLTRPEFLAARDALTRRIEALRQKVAVATGVEVLADVGPGIRDAWAEMSFDRRRSVLAQLISNVTIGPAVRGRIRFDPDRVDVEWRH